MREPTTTAIQLPARNLKPALRQLRDAYKQLLDQAGYHLPNERLYYDGRDDLSWIVVADGCGGAFYLEIEDYDNGSDNCTETLREYYDDEPDAIARAERRSSAEYVSPDEP